MAQDDHQLRGADGSLFEAIARAHRPDAALTEKLSELGVDLGRLEINYRAPVWAQALELFRAARYPALPAEQGYRRLGFDFAQSYSQTMVGALLIATLPLLGPARLLHRWPRFVRMGRTDVTLTVTESGPNAISVHSIDPARVPAAFNLGIFDYVFERMKVKVTMQVEREAGDEALVHYRW